MIDELCCFLVTVRVTDLKFLLPLSFEVLTTYLANGSYCDLSPSCCEHVLHTWESLPYERLVLLNSFTSQSLVCADRTVLKLLFVQECNTLDTFLCNKIYLTMTEVYYCLRFITFLALLPRLSTFIYHICTDEICMLKFIMLYAWCQNKLIYEYIILLSANMSLSEIKVTSNSDKIRHSLFSPYREKNFLVVEVILRRQSVVFS